MPKKKAIRVAKLKGPQARKPLIWKRWAIRAVDGDDLKPYLYLSRFAAVDCCEIGWMVQKVIVVGIP